MNLEWLPEAFIGFTVRDDWWKYEFETNSWFWIEGSQGAGLIDFDYYKLEQEEKVPYGRTDAFIHVSDEGVWMFGGGGAAHYILPTGLYIFKFLYS